MKGKKVVEVMSGIGRHLPIYLEAEPQLVVMVDMNAEALNESAPIACSSPEVIACIKPRHEYNRLPNSSVKDAKVELIA